MITMLGKELRKLRLDLGCTLFEMANQIGMSTSLLSAVETGRRPAPADFIDRLAEHYSEVENDRKRFQSLADNTVKEVRIRMSEEESRPRAAELAVTFARKFDELSDQQINSMFKIFGTKGKGDL